ncbi:MAG: cytochrome C biogenesis protein [Nitrososphaerota archaeon]|nr:cytochrome C biogenesis protein [Nitrososphaerota archaeon]
MQSLETRKLLVVSLFVLFSFVFLGIISSFTVGIVGANNALSYSSWLVIAYIAGLSMIILPCTMPVVFVIVPLSMGHGYKKGLGMSLLFGAGLVATITLYGLGVAILGNTASLDQISFTMFVIAGIIAYIFGLSQLRLVDLKIPTYSGTPKFILERGDYTKSLFMGLLLGNAGVGCPNPMFYWLLIYIAGTGSVEVGSSLGLVHGVGRAIPLILISALAIIGVNTTKGLVANRIKIEKMTGWMLVFLGSFLIINGIPGGHQWYEETFVHIMWNNLVSMSSISPEFHVGQHTHDPLPIEMPRSMVPVVLISLLAAPIMWKIYINRKERVAT